MAASKEVSYDFLPYDCTPGELFDAFEERLLNGCTNTDDRGYSLADCLLCIDEGSAGGPAIVGTPVQTQKANAARLKRLKQSYGSLTKHLAGGSSADHLTYMKQNHFQNGYDAWTYLAGQCRTPITLIRLKELDAKWDAVDLLTDVGVNENTIHLLSVRISTTNSRRPVANQKSRTEKAEKLLECIFSTSKHFSEQALVEYNALPGSRQFEHAIGPFAGQRDYDGLTTHYQQLWSSAVTSKLPGFHVRAPTAKPPVSQRGTLEAGLSMLDMSGAYEDEGALFRAQLHGEAGSTNFVVPRAGSPSRSLAFLAEAGDDLASRHGVCTTTDWSSLNGSECMLAVDEGEVGGEGDAVYLFDADDTPSIEIICDCCRGIGHVKRVCPSSRNRFRSFQYAIAALNAKLAKVGKAPPRRPPGRGQRAPFQTQPRRFQQRRADLSRPGAFAKSSRDRPYRPPRAMAAEEGDEEDSEISATDPRSSQSLPPSSSSGSERLGIVEERKVTEKLQKGVQKGVSFAAEELSQPLIFSDDLLFKEESLRVAIEQTAPVVTEQQPPPPPKSRVLSRWIQLPLGSLLLAALAGFYYSMERLAAAGVAAIVILLTICVAGTCALSLQPSGQVSVPLLPSPQVLYPPPLPVPFEDTLPLCRADEQLLTVEQLTPGGEHGYIARPDGLRIIVDSGATSTSMSVSRAPLFAKKVIDASPNQSIKIADSKYLSIVQIVEAEFPADGYRLLPDSTREPRLWDEQPCSAGIVSSRTLVVDGLDDDIVLLAVRGLKRDKIKVFFNDDNSIQREDCLLLDDQKTVIPFRGTIAYEISGSGDSVCVGNETITNRRSDKVPLYFHRALGHIGDARRSHCNITIDGVHMQRLSSQAHHSCVGCRLGNTNRSRWMAQRKPSQSMQPGRSSLGITHFGQQVESDICTGFVPSFPHQFSAMVNFIDLFAHEVSLSFLRAGDSSEVSSSLKAYIDTNESRLPDGKIGMWKCDNSTTFLSHETEQAAKFLVEKRTFSVPYEKNTLAVPERNWGVLERMIRSFLADASGPESNQSVECLWTWCAAQATHLLYYLPTAALVPPQSPYQKSTGNTATVDLSWARTMLCDVTVTLPDRDRSGKLSHRSCDGCHLGYDKRRGGHFVYCPSLQRISTFNVKEWREDAFTIARGITSDTPVEYFEASDLTFSPSTAERIPRRHRAPRAAAASESEHLHVIAVFHRERPDSVITMLRAHGHTVTSYDLQNSVSEDLTVAANQHRVLDEIPRASFCLLCPPCSSSNIALSPPWRTFPDHVRGVPGLATRHQKIVDAHNTLFDFTAECILKCNEHNVPWALESCAARRRPDKAEWQRFSSSAMIWDYPPIERIMNTTTATYRCCAQCQWDAPHQKYTGWLTSGGPASRAFDVVFGHGVCDCTSHAQVLQGFDDAGVANTTKAEEYNPQFSAALTTAVLDTCGLDEEGVSQHDQEGELNVCAVLRKLNQSEISRQAAASLLSATENPDAPVTSGLTRGQITELHATAYRHRLDLSPDMEIVIDVSEGAFSALDAFRVSETGTELAEIKTVQQARESRFWPLIKKAMEDEIHGKMKNGAWKVVSRPKHAKVHRSRWVLGPKLGTDGTLIKFKARFVGCGYSMSKDIEYDNVFAATLPGVSFRLLCCCIATENLDTDHIDAIKAFTQADIDREVYVEMPEGFDVKGCVCLLLKALEGIKQGAYLWFALNRAAWLKLGFKTWMNETNLYLLPGLKIRAGVFADDVLIGFPSGARAQYLAIKKEYGKIVNISGIDTISPAIKFVGVQVERDRTQKTVRIHQTRYIEQLEIEFKGKVKQQDTPFGVSKEQRGNFSKLVERLDDTSSPAFDKHLYLQLIGKLVWPSSMTRPDIAMAVSVLCSCMGSPRQCHYDAALVVLGYLITTKTLGITYGGPLVTPFGLSENPPHFEESDGLHCMHDSSWGQCARPMGGFVIMYCNGAVDYSAKTVKIVPDSSCEAETAVASFATKAVCFVRENLREQGRRLYGPTAMVGDNKAMYENITKEGASVRTRYFERATLLVKRAVLLLLLKPFLVPTEYMLADIFTKPTDKSTFIRMRNRMMNIHSGLRSELMLGASALAGGAAALARRLTSAL